MIPWATRLNGKDPAKPAVIAITSKAARAVMAEARSKGFTARFSTEALTKDASNNGPRREWQGHEGLGMMCLSCFVMDLDS
jgi:hypothetical protein